MYDQYRNEQDHPVECQLLVHMGSGMTLTSLTNGIPPWQIVLLNNIMYLSVVLVNLKVMIVILLSLTVMNYIPAFDCKAFHQHCEIT